MNIFATSNCPIESAIALDDKRLVKMVLESAQLLSTAMWVWGLTSPYKPTHMNHPSNVWARETRANYWWLVRHFEAQFTEYTHRYGRTHKCSQYLDTFKSVPPSDKKHQTFAFAGPDDIKRMDIPVTDKYQMYMCRKWHADYELSLVNPHVRPARWTNRQPPTWSTV